MQMLFQSKEFRWIKPVKWSHYTKCEKHAIILFQYRFLPWARVEKVKSYKRVFSCELFVLSEKRYYFYFCCCWSCEFRLNDTRCIGKFAYTALPRLDSNKIVNILISNKRSVFAYITSFSEPSSCQPATNSSGESKTENQGKICYDSSCKVDRKSVV